MDTMQSVGGFDGAATAAGGQGARQSKVDRVYLALKQAIVSGELAPLTPVDKGEWSARFEVSRLSITSAINRLAFESLVVVQPQRGSYVSKIRLVDVKQWMMMRRLLEIEVAALCATELPERAIDQLSQNLTYQRAALDSDDLAGFHELDTRFHRQMTNGLDLRRVGEALDSLRMHLDRVRRTLLPAPGRIEATYAEHRAIFEAIAERRPERAADSMRAHLGSVLRELEDFVSQHPGFFEGQLAADLGR
jgi:GntR family transcriptional regulator, rspAB operon transcriptional repressor